MNNNVRKLTDGAMMCAIVGVVLLINRQTAGLLEDMALFLFPIPMVFYAAKYGMKDSWPVLAAMILLTLILGTPQTLFYVGAESMMGLFYGNGIYTHQDTRKLVFLTMLIGVAVNLLSTIVFAAFFGYDLVGETDMYKTALNDAMSKNGLSLPDTINLDQYLKTILIVSTILMGIMEGYITHMLSRLLLKRLRFPIAAPTPLSQYLPPIWSGYLGLAGLVAYYYSIYRPLADSLWQNLMQGLGMCGFLYLIIFGMIGMVAMGVMRNPKLKVVIILLALFLMISASLMVAVFGFLYITTDIYRRHLNKGDSHASENG